MTVRMRRVSVLLMACALVVFAAPGVSAAGVAAAAGPTTAIFLDPPTPDGASGWYVTPPEVRIVTDGDGDAHWWWDAGAETTGAVTAGVPLYVGDAPEDLSDFYCYTVGIGGAGDTATVSLKVDAVPPTLPGSLAATAGPALVALEWLASTDATSGVTHYNIYRNSTGLPFTIGDLYDSSLATSYVDTTLPSVPFLYYAVSAVDGAGWESVLTASVQVTPDSTPPTTPGDVQAWLNASNWIRVSWNASIDTGSGMSHYVVYRSLEGGPMSAIATVAAGSTYYEDHDASAAAAGSASYEVIAFDRVGLASAVGGPASRQQDISLPAIASGPVVAPVYSGTYSNAAFDVSWTSTDAGSGVSSTELLYGPTSGAPIYTRTVSGSAERVTSLAPTTLWYFQVRAQDRAGNLSALTTPAGGRNVASERVAGATRVSTAIEISEATFGSAATIVVASSQSFPDALAGGALAGAVGGPILLAGSGPLPAETLAEISRLGVVDAYVVGGTAAVSAQTELSLSGAIPGTVSRIAGTTRYDTAADIAREVSARAGGAAPPRAFVVSGRSFADALSAAPAAYAEGSPVLYATADGVPQATLDAIADVSAPETLILGGALAVSGSAESVLPTPTRVAGADRYATSRAFAEWAEGEALLDRTAPVIATGRAFADGLAAGPMAGQRGSILLLTNDASAATSAAWMAGARSTMTRQTIVGGTLAVSAATQQTFWQHSSTP